VDIPRPSKLIRNVDPQAENWVCQLADLMLDMGVEKNATMASSSARDIARIPKIGQAVKDISQGVFSLRESTGTLLTPSQKEILDKALTSLIKTYSETCKSFQQNTSS
jgi:predicted DNA binding protein